MPRWEVPYESPDRTLIRYVFALLFSIGVLAPLCALTFSDKQSWVTWVVGPLLVATTITLVWRIVLVGVWIGDRGVKISMIVRTRVVPWPELDRVWLAPATGFDALALWISVRNGPDIETAIWRANSPAVHRNRAKLEQPELSALMERLRAEAQRHSS
ncbi:hypothetical protein [Paractinoplanes durhamensis]|uniref:PH domain-containing protein n=1 Tax=Paractinoplanes durhamensis TaxID=113563 RepID=A0ABQ3YT26_9ACTN|nr:hypothetical protein [Actinoplanes durhamensis]GIE00731.1 hypothetical protein Adu01nite_20810 [Actinoplanes durhamensis]